MTGRGKREGRGGGGGGGGYGGNLFNKTRHLIDKAMTSDVVQELRGTGKSKRRKGGEVGGKEK